MKLARVEAHVRLSRFARPLSPAADLAGDGGSVCSRIVNRVDSARTSTCQKSLRLATQRAACRFRRCRYVAVFSGGIVRFVNALTLLRDRPRDFRRVMERRPISRYVHVCALQEEV